jgi:hypothetical protein
VRDGTPQNEWPKPEIAIPPKEEREFTRQRPQIPRERQLRATRAFSTSVNGAWSFVAKGQILDERDPIAVKVAKEDPNLLERAPQPIA